MRKLISIIIIIILCAAAYLDMLYKKINILVLAALGIFCAISMIIKAVSLKEIIINMAISLVLLGICFLTHEAIGYADIFIIGITGLQMRSWNFILYVFMSFLLSGIAGFIIMFLLRKDKKYEIPFCPFAAISYFIAMFL